MVLSLTFAIVEGPQKGWSSTLVTGLFAGTCTLLALFVMIERRRSRPMLDLTLFRYGRFIGAQMLPIGTAFAFVVPLVLLPTRFVGIHGMSAADAGAMMLPLCAPMVIVPFLGALLSRHVSSGLLSGIGLTVAAAGLLWIALLPESAAVGQLVWPMLTIGVGSGLPWGLMDDLAVSVVPKERAGMATGVFSTMRLTGEAIALASATALLVGLMQGQLREELATRAAGMSAIDLDRRPSRGNSQHAGIGHLGEHIDPVRSAWPNRVSRNLCARVHADVRDSGRHRGRLRHHRVRHPLPDQAPSHAQCASAPPHPTP